VDIHYSEIKDELQGDNGLIKLIRKRYLPNTVVMSQLAQKKFEETINDFSNTDFALDSLLKIEYDTYLEKQRDITDKFIEYADSEASSTDFPSIRKVIDSYKNDSSTKIDSTKILTGIVNISVALADSNRQSRVSRSGSSLMHHISYLLEKNGFVFKKDFQREFVLKSGCKLDFFFPDFATYNQEPKNCCAVACQTTSNDRFRLTFAQMPHDTRNRACTAIGCSNFGLKLGPSSLTDTKLIESKKNGVKFVILASALNARLISSNSVISYQEWFDELKSIKHFWK